MSVVQKEYPADASGETGARQVLEMNEVTMQGGTVEIGDRDLRVAGGFFQGGVVRGEGGVSVRGHVSGSLLHRCVIEVGGDVTVEGDIRGARIRCRSLRAGGGLEQVEVLTDQGVEVGGSLKGAEVQVGMRGAEHLEIKTLMRDVSRQEADLTAMEGGMRMASRRFQRDYANIDIQFGNIITKSRRGVEVDLKDLYRILHDRSEEEVDKGLQEFFFKVIVGALTRANRVYVSQNPSRQNIFLKLVSELREHLMEVRTRDKIQTRLNAFEKRRKELTESLLAPSPWGMAVHGQIGPETVIRLLQFKNPVAEATEEMFLDRRSGHLRVVAQESDELVLNLVSLDGTAAPKRNVPLSELCSVKIFLKEGLPAWEGLPED